MSQQKIRAAIIGGSEDGKTFLTAGLIRGHWVREHRRSIVFDPWKGETGWGPGAWVTKDFERFKAVAFKMHDCAVVWDEGTSTGGRDRDNLEFFTAIRHNHPYFYFIGHGYSTMLPIMRGSLTDVVMAVRDPDDAQEWAKVMVDQTIITDAQSLKQYEFLHKRKHQPSRILRYKPDQILRGINL